MFSRYFLTFCVLTSTLFTFSNAGSSSISCIYSNGERRCSQRNDPNGNTAVAAAGMSGGSGVAGTGVGTSDNLNTDFQQIGYGEENGGNQQPPNFGSNGGGVYVGVGNPFVPNFNGDPFQFVQDFMKGRRNV